ncbi:ABC transporter permease subunit [Kitasatospora sp. CB02891]|uniref:ABC transporter permease subunit n=1 Tax=Kitasatospora sp. CB02891 TaxID=2020329 RepID=UPI000C27599E|nr:ABC transporter permease subunit [Kitasatospora sp. CB02891]PJN21482.1 transporter [Kitasatospora sp. CB02891]
MTWLTWRQFRAQFLAAAAVLVAATAYLLISGLDLRDKYHDLTAGCPDGGCADGSQLLDTYVFPYWTGSALVLLVPALIGAFWGAPLIARELETGTYRLIWNQGIGRGRWLTVKLLLVGVTAVTVTGLLSLLVTWFASPLDHLNRDRFTPLLFASRGIVPLGYAAFAVALGSCLGLFLRRTVAAMAVTLAVFAAVQVLVPLAVRPHLEQPVHSVVALDAATLRSTRMLGFTGSHGPSATFVAGLAVPDAWMLSDSSPIRDSSERVLTFGTQPCANNSHDVPSEDCLAHANLHVAIDYQPADRYWPFQWIETAIFLALTAALTALTTWGLHRRLG